MFVAPSPAACQHALCVWDGDVGILGVGGLGLGA